MPAFLTHRAAGERVIEKIGEQITHKGAFYLGCQGPDILFFRNYMPWRNSKKSRALGITMHHEKIRRLFTEGLAAVKAYEGEDKPELVSYFCGFVTHYAIDKNAHPFVYEKTDNDGTMHHALEFMWDSYSAKEQWDIEPGAFNIYDDVMYAPVGQGIVAWYRQIAKDVHGVKIRPGMVRQAQRHFARAKRALRNVGWVKKMIMRIISRMADIDVKTMRYPPKRDESQFLKEEYKDMQKMIARGVDEAAEMVGHVLAAVAADGAAALPEWFGDTDFSGSPAS